MTFRDLCRSTLVYVFSRSHPSLPTTMTRSNCLMHAQIWRQSGHRWDSWALLLERICQEMPRVAKTQAPWRAQQSANQSLRLENVVSAAQDPDQTPSCSPKSWVPTGATVPSQRRMHYTLFITVFTFSATTCQREPTTCSEREKEQRACLHLAPEPAPATGVQIWNPLTRPDSVDVLDCRAMEFSDNPNLSITRVRQHDISFRDRLDRATDNEASSLCPSPWVKCRLFSLLPACVRNEPLLWPVSPRNSPRDR